MAVYNNNDKYMVRQEVLGTNPFGEAVRPDVNLLNMDTNMRMRGDYDAFVNSTGKDAEREYYNFYQNYGMDPRDYGEMIKNQTVRSIPNAYKSNSMSDVIKTIQTSIYDNTPFGKNYGSNFVDGKYGNSTASAMIDTLNTYFNADITNDGTTADKTKKIQYWLKSNGFKGADGKDLVLDGTFGKNTAEAFSRAYLAAKEQMIKSQEIVDRMEAAEAAKREAEALAAQQAAQEAEAYKQSQAVRAEQPNRNMFAGVNLPMPEVFARNEVDPTQPVDVGYSYGGYIGRDIYGRPVYAEK